MPVKTKSIASPAALPAAAASRTDAGVADLAIATRVLRMEAEGILALLDRLDASFGAALDLLEKVSGRVIVTGMGKSGHVARKIAATLASTGTPAQFVHPAEASHGDLGMIVAADAVLALSNSGETEELSDLIVHTRRFSIPLIGVTRAAESSLAQQADVTLLLPSVPEACPLGLAPTTSTTVMLALGDALAVALFERKGFSANDFHQFHPKGALGRSFIRVADLMHKGAAVPLVGESAVMADAIVVMSEKRLGCVGVRDGAGRLVGVITDGDLRRHMRPDLLNLTAAKIMTREPKTIEPQALAAKALAIMNQGQRRVTTLFVVEDERPVGILHVHDCLRAGVV